MEAVTGEVGEQYASHFAQPLLAVGDFVDCLDAGVWCLAKIVEFAALGGAAPGRRVV
jgi:hypothetical protein